MEELVSAIATQLGGKVTKRAEMFNSLITQFCVHGKLNGIRYAIYLGAEGGFATVDSFRSTFPFRFSLFHRHENAGLVSDVTSRLKLPVPVFAGGASELDCLQNIFTDWSTWETVLLPFQNVRHPMFLCDSQCEFIFDRDINHIIGEAILPLILRFTSSPFKAQSKDEPSRYTDLSGVVIDTNNVPANLSALIPLAIKWSILDEVELLSYVDKQPENEINRFLTRFNERYAEIDDFCTTAQGQVPVSDTAMIFVKALDVFALLLAESKLKTIT